MVELVDEVQWTAARMAAQVVRYGDLKPCFNAFIDCRTPGSEAKENFTIIGPGVSENPAQHVHIAEPHGFNIGGARQPPHCVNSQHSHDTAEVFVVHSGHWRFDLGEHGEDALVELHPGDVISLPTQTFRGFTNIGAAPGFLWAVLGQDNPGRVTWAPQVFEMARDYGLVLLESGRLVDTTAGETVPPEARPMQPTSAEAAAQLQRLDPTAGERLVVRAGATSAPVIGADAPLDWPHGFTLDRLVIAAGETAAPERDSVVEVVFVDRGALRIEWDGGTLELGPGDTMTVPAIDRRFTSAGGATAFVVHSAAM